MAAKRRHHPSRRLAIGLALLAPAILVLAPSVSAQAPPTTPDAGQPFAPVVDEVVRGDIVLAGNSNLLSAGGWRDPSVTAADVDGDSTLMCIERTAGDGALLDLFSSRRWVCADNSSSADLDFPAGASVIAARLYVETSADPGLGPVRVSLDGPDEGYAYRSLPGSPPLAEATSTTSTTSTSTSTTPTTSPTSTSVTASPPDPAKLYEATGGGNGGDVLRHAVWDLTEYVQRAGPGTYTVADIVNDRAGPWLPYASWSIVIAYELALDADLGEVAPADRHRFAARAVSWHDGFAYLEAGTLEVAVRVPDLAPGTTTFGKALQVIAGGRRDQSDNLLFAGAPLGNNAMPGDAPPPPGVVLGTDPACNTVTDVQNDSVCVFGAVVATKSPGPADFRASGDGRTPSSGSGVDMDVIRIPDRYLSVAGRDATLAVQSTGGDALAPAVLAVAIDVPGGAP